LKVNQDWFAPQDRAMTEGAVLTQLQSLTPAAVPPVVAVDAQRFVIVMNRAPSSWLQWKQRLFDGVIDRRTGAQLGELLAHWHRADVLIPSAVDSAAAFRSLRIDPYYRTAAALNPEVADRMTALAKQLSTRTDALVHGDFSPKNILVSAEDGARLWVLDWEVAHRGDPVFDVAFLLSHLALKTIAMPARAGLLRGVARAFVDSYLMAGGDAGSGEYVFGHVGCLLLARVDGKSPVEYLDNLQRDVVRAVGRGLIANPASDVTSAWVRLGVAADE
jgi:aminoglycoside phosphotransferase (APT) family kinase protein